jgi:hypothetical protein
VIVKRKMVVPIYARPGGSLMMTVEVVGSVGALSRLAVRLVAGVATFHNVGEPRIQSAKEFLRRHPELKE